MKALIDALEDLGPPAPVCVYAMTALGELGPEAAPAVRALATHLTERHNQVFAQDALRRIGKAALPELEAMATDTKLPSELRAEVKETIRLIQRR